MSGQQIGERRIDNKLYHLMSLALTCIIVIAIWLIGQPSNIVLGLVSVCCYLLLKIIIARSVRKKLRL